MAVVPAQEPTGSGTHRSTEAENHVAPSTPDQAAGTGQTAGPALRSAVDAGNGVLALEAREITRRFPGVLANDRVSFELRHGEIHALLGENGSGKTTLCKILTGLYWADDGEVLLDGERVTFSSPAEACEVGIFMVQQHFSLVDRLTVAENVVLGWTRERSLRYKPKKIETEVAAVSEKYQLRVDPKAYVWQLSVGERQRVEILKALYRQARILIMDEPTTVLTPAECEGLFENLRGMARAGTSVIFISHKLREVAALCDRVTVLRRGRSVGSVDVKAGGVDHRELARLMVGHEIALNRKQPVEIAADAAVALSVENLSVVNDFGRVEVKDVSLQIRRGEVLGLAGVAGNGQRELAEGITGLRRRSGGSVSVDGRGLRPGRVDDAIAASMAYVPEDRLGTGLVPSLKVTDNVALKSSKSRRFCWGPFLRARRVLEYTNELLERFDVRGNATNTVRQLSGGNAQKVLLGREMSSSPNVLVVSALTRGLDVSAMESVRALLLEAAAGGVAVLLISEDLDEVLDLADRVAVIHRGQIMATVPPDTDRDTIGLMMAGVEA